MNQLKAPALLLIVFAIKVSSCFDRKFAMSVDERIENCADPKFDAKALDLSELELIAESDFEVFINGTAKFTREHRSSIPFQILAERFDRNQWHLSVMNTKRDDFCKSIHNLAELWGAKMMKFKGCPLKVGDKWKFNMEPAFDFPMLYTGYLAGKWRVSITTNFSDNTYNCIRFFGEVIEV